MRFCDGALLYGVYREGDSFVEETNRDALEVMRKIRGKIFENVENLIIISTRYFNIRNNFFSFYISYTYFKLDYRL